MLDSGFSFIGDTHIGRRFRTGVPLNRLGEREELIYNLFTEKLYDNNHNIHTIIHLGDLFDRPTVGYDDLFRTFNIIKGAAEQYPFRNYYFIQGNHDMSRNREMVTAFGILKTLLRDTENVIFIDDEVLVDGNLTFVPYTKNEEFIKYYNFLPVYKNMTLFGHFDEPFPHYIFKDFLNVVTGHIHIPREENNIIVIGSIIPMTFGEDPAGKLYRTLTLSEFEAVQNNPYDKEGEWRDYCYRVILRDGETLPENPGCRQLISIKKDDLEILPENLLESLSDFPNFDMDSLLKKVLEETGLFDEIYKRYLELRAELNV